MRNNSGLQIHEEVRHKFCHFDCKLMNIAAAVLSRSTNVFLIRLHVANKLNENKNETLQAQQMNVPSPFRTEEESQIERKSPKMMKEMITHRNYFSLHFFILLLLPFLVRFSCTILSFLSIADLQGIHRTCFNSPHCSSDMNRFTSIDSYLPHISCWQPSPIPDNESGLRTECRERG